MLHTAEQEQLEMNKDRLSLGTRIGYGMGDIFGGGSTTVINIYFMYFLTDIAGVRPGLAGVAILISKLWDAVTDPFMGLISDNTRTRYGRRRPYFLAGIPLIFISFLLMWLSPDFSGEWTRFCYYLGAYILFSTVYTMVWVPYNSIAADLTPDYNERTRLSTYRMVFSNLAGILAAILPRDLFENLLFPGNPKTAYLVMALCFGLLFSLPYIATFRLCRENQDFMRLPKIPIGSIRVFFRNSLFQPFANRPFRSIVMMYLFGFMAQDWVLGLAVYFLTYALGIPNMMTLLVPVYGGLLAALPLAERLGEKTGKRSAYIAAGLLWILALTMVLFMRPGMPMAVMYVFGILFGAGLAGVQVMIFAMFPDIPDADELVSGKRREGLYSGIFSLLRKAGGALVLFMVAQFLSLSGYLPPLSGVQQIQTPRFLANLTLVFAGVPALLVLIAVAAAIRYPLTRSRLDQIRAITEAGRHGTALSPGQEQQKSELVRLIGGIRDE
jgi:oligogalacturonide transporter